ncbi:MAG: metal-sensitive transcriptional regulator [bacterium]|nr:metal-sensitive transcriptional regulator [bacterium]
MPQKQLISRLNRANGQINAIKQLLENQNDQDCLKVLQQLKASINALKKFGEAYMEEHLDACLKEGKSQEELKENLRNVISGTFYL